MILQFCVITVCAVLMTAIHTELKCSVCVIPKQTDNTCPLRAQYILNAWRPCVQWNGFTLSAFSSLNVHFLQAIPALTCLIVSHISTYQLAFAFQNVEFLSSAIWLCINLFRIIIMLLEFSISLMTARHLSPRAAKQPKNTWIVLLGCIFFSGIFFYIFWS